MFNLYLVDFSEASFSQLLVVKKWQDEIIWDDSGEDAPGEERRCETPLFVIEVLCHSGVEHFLELAKLIGQFMVDNSFSVNVSIHVY